MSFESISLQPPQLLAAINENLNNRFYAASRAESKQAYQQLIAGQTVPFMLIGVEDGAQIQCDLKLDDSEFVGNISYSKFRKALAMMMLGIKNRLEAEQNLNLMQSDAGDTLFNIPGVHQDEDGANVIVCGISQNGPGRAFINLMFLDPQAYVNAAAEGAAS